MLRGEFGASLGEAVRTVTGKTPRQSRGRQYFFITLQRRLWAWLGARRAKTSTLVCLEWSGIICK